MSALLWLVLVAPATSFNEPVGIVLHGVEGVAEYTIKYQGRTISCKSRRPCEGLTDGAALVATMRFTRDRELIDYVNEAPQLRTCMLRECVDAPAEPEAACQE
jgi:hypothetical protein